MWLQRFTDKSRLAVCVVTLLVIAGCGGSGGVRDTGASGQRTGGAAPADGAAAGPEIPAQAMTLFEQATAVMAAGDLVDAELRFKEFVLLYPDDPGAYVNLAIIHAQNEDDENARTVLDQALALDAEYAPALNQLGMLLRRNGNFLEAEAAYLKAVTVSPDYALAHYNLGVLNELYLQRLDTALQHFEAYQTLVGEDKQVERWIVDLRRRVAASQRTANVAD